MIYWIQQRELGEVHRVDDTVVTTRFVIINGIPLAPSETFVSWTRLPDGERLSVTIPLLGRSVLAGYLPRTSLLAAAFLCVCAFFASTGLGIGLWIASGVSVAVLGRLVLRRLRHVSEADATRRRIYGAWLGPAVDPLLLGATIEPCVASLRGYVTSRACGSEALGYRGGPVTHKAWFDAALASDDVALQGAAMTLARAEMGRTSDRAEAVRLAAWHDALFDVLAPRAEAAAAVPGVTELQRVDPIAGNVAPTPRSRAARWIAIPAVAAGLAIAGVVGYVATHPKFVALNLGEHPRIAFAVDGEPLESSVASLRQVRTYATTRVAIGTRKLEARDELTGEVLDRVTIHVGLLDATVVYAPARLPDACLYLQHAVYTSSPNRTPPPDESRLLDPSATVWVLRESVDDILAAPPASVTLNDHSSETTRWALRDVKCRIEREGDPDVAAE